eukprot:jgi/Mesvir1/18855/Mv03455-RA.1
MEGCLGSTITDGCVDRFVANRGNRKHPDPEPRYILQRYMVLRQLLDETPEVSRIMRVKDAVKARVPLEIRSRVDMDKLFSDQDVLFEKWKVQEARNRVARAEKQERIAREKRRQEQAEDSKKQREKLRKEQIARDKLARKERKMAPFRKLTTIWSPAPKESQPPPPPPSNDGVHVQPPLGACGPQPRQVSRGELQVAQGCEAFHAPWSLSCLPLFDSAPVRLDACVHW